MQKVTLTIQAESPAAEEVSATTLFDVLKGTKGVTLSLPQAKGGGKYRARITGLEVLAAFLTSTAAYQLAHAIRDYVNRQKVDVHVTTQDGRELTIRAEGGDTPTAADLVGFLTKQHRKKSSAPKRIGRRLPRRLKDNDPKKR